MSRKSLSKKIRFEVFKRDSFTCQYCGKVAPEAILQVDHIEPVSKGGSDDLYNLITSCRDCNLGKRDRRLSDDSVALKQRQAIHESAERIEQRGMLVLWQKNISNTDKRSAEMLHDYFTEVSQFHFIDSEAISHYQKLLKRFSFDFVLESINIAVDRYCDGTVEGARNALQKIGGISHNRSVQGGDPVKMKVHQLIYYARDRWGAIHHSDTKDQIEIGIKYLTFEEIKNVIDSITDYYHLEVTMWDAIYHKIEENRDADSEIY